MTAKIKIYPVRFTPDEYASAKARAGYAGMSFSEFIRKSAANYNPPPKASFPLNVLATVQELNAIAVNARQISARAGEPLSSIAAERADWLQEQIAGVIAGRMLPLKPEILEQVKEQGKYVNGLAHAVNAGKEISPNGFETALNRIWQLMAGE